MSFQSITGQERAINMLRSSLRNRRLSHAYLFSGPAGTGKRKAAESLAQALFCVEQSDDACGHCAECRKVENGNHPELQIIEPSGTNIKLEQIRSLQRDFAFKAGPSYYKIYIIVDADRMTKEAANSLLKFLEEPIAGIIGILLSNNGQAIIPTLRSRSQLIPFVPMSPQFMYESLVQEGHPAALVRPAVHLASGIDGARQMFQMNWFAEVRDVMIRLMQEHVNRIASASVAIQQLVMKTEIADHIDILLDLSALWFKDFIHIQTGRRERVVFVEQADWIAQHSYTRDTSHWVYCMEHALEAKRRLRSHVNPQLVLEQFMIRIQGG